MISTGKGPGPERGYGHSLERELGYLVAHGCCTFWVTILKPRRKRQLMRSLEEMIMQKVKLER